MISIITPTYNRQEKLQRTIKSILAQTSDDWELFVVDDGSTDETEQVVQQYLTDSRIKYIKKENTGAAHTRNVGATYAKGEFIAFLDSDDELLPNYVEVVSKELKSNIGLISVGIIRQFENGVQHEELPHKPKLFGRKLCIQYNALIMRKTVFDAIGGFDSNLKSSHFTDISIRLYQQLMKTKLQIIPILECLIRVHIHSGPRIRNNWNLVKEGSIQFTKKHADFIKDLSKEYLADTYGVIAFACFRVKERRNAIKYSLLAIKYKPMKYKYYLRLLKYTFR